MASAWSSRRTEDDEIAAGLRLGVAVALLGAVAGLAGGPGPAAAQPDAVIEASQRCLDDNRNGDYAAAVDDCTQTIMRDPKNAVAYVIAARPAQNLRMYAAAIADCTRTIALDPRNSSAYSNRCAGYTDTGNYGAAIADCTQAIGLDPTYVNAYINRCNSYVQSGNNASAILDCGAAIALRSEPGCGLYGSLLGL